MSVSILSLGYASIWIILVMIQCAIGKIIPAIRLFLEKTCDFENSGYFWNKMCMHKNSFIFEYYAGFWKVRLIFKNLIIFPHFPTFFLKIRLFYMKSFLFEFFGKMFLTEKWFLSLGYMILIYFIFNFMIFRDIWW